MKKSGSSRTAELAAMTRTLARHSTFASAVMNDPFAKYFMGNSVLIPYFFNRIFLVLNPQFWKKGINSVGFLITVCRHRFFSDLIIQSVIKGIRQVVLLGAGYDTNILRNIEPLKDTKIFEIDHPNTQSRKIRIIRRNSLVPHEKTSFIGLDLVQDSINDRLMECGLNNKEPLLVIAEGVLSYLPMDAFDSLVKSISGLSEKVLFAGDYRYPRLTDKDVNLTIKRWRNEFRMMNEKYLSFFTKEEIEDKLSMFDFHTRKHTNLADLWLEYTGEQSPKHLREIAGLFVSECDRKSNKSFDTI